MKIINYLKDKKTYMPDLQIKEILTNLYKLYVINIQTVSNSSLSNSRLSAISITSFYSKILETVCILL